MQAYDGKFCNNKLTRFSTTPRNIYCCLSCKTTRIQALGKLGNIVAETLCFLSMYQYFPIRSPRETLLRKQNLFSRKQKCFPTNSKTFLLRKQCFLVCPHVFKCFQHEKHCLPAWACSNNVLRL